MNMLPDRVEATVHQLERPFPVTPLEVFTYARVLAGESPIPHRNHRVWRGRDDDVYL